MFTPTAATMTRIRAVLNIAADIPLRLVDQASSHSHDSFGAFDDGFLMDWRAFGTLDMSAAITEHQDEQAFLALLLLLGDPDRYDESAFALAHLLDGGTLTKPQVIQVFESLKIMLNSHPQVRNEMSIVTLIDYLQDEAAISDGSKHEIWGRR